MKRLLIALVALAVATQAHAYKWGSYVVNNNRVTINFQEMQYTNLWRGFGIQPDPTNMDTNGYPITTPTNNLGANGAGMPASYYDPFVLKWAGTGAIDILSGPPIIVTASTVNGVSGTVLNNLGAATGTVAGATNLTFCGSSCTTNVNNPRTVFSFGWLIQSISNNGSGLIRINTQTNYVASCSGYGIQSGPDQNGNIGKLVNITGANANTGANGLWSVTNCTASSFDLVGSAFTNAQASAAGTAIIAASSPMTIRIRNSGTFSGFTSVVWCRQADETQIANGQLLSDDYIAQLQYVMGQGRSPANDGWLRFMDFTGVQSSFESDFDERLPSTYMTFPQGAGFFRPDYYAGAITNGGSDNYTMANPAHSGVGSYQDQEIVQGKMSGTNTGNTPTLNVGGRGAKPIFSPFQNSAIPWYIQLISSGTPTPGTDVLQFTFQASWLNGGTPVVVNYTTQTGDNTLCGTSALSAHLQAAFAANATLTGAGIQFSNPLCAQGPAIIPRSAQAGRLSITYTSGPAIVTGIGAMFASQLSASSNVTFIYNYLLDGWLYQSSGLTMSGPLEIAVEAANRVGANVWWNWGSTKGSFVTSVTQFFGDPTTGLSPGQRFGGECANEIWNDFAFPKPYFTVFGQTLSFLQGPFSYCGLRMAQYSQLMLPAWTGKGRSASDLYVMSMHQLGQGIGSTFDTYQLQGTELNTGTNAVYAAYGGLNGSGAPTTAYNTSPNRPVDLSTVVGDAPYWNSHWWGSGSFTQASQVAGTAAQNQPWLQAALDYANGNTSTAFTSLVNQFNRSINRATCCGGPNTGSDFIDFKNTFIQDEALAASYDSSRPSGVRLGIMQYEGGPSFGLGNNGNVGVNSISVTTVSSTDISALATQMTTLDSPAGSFNVSPYTVSGTDNKTEMATMTLELMQGWKFDQNLNGTPANTGAYKTMIKTWYYQQLKTISGGNREAKPAQFGTVANNWAWQPISVIGNTPYQNREALHEWNAGN